MDSKTINVSKDLDCGDTLESNGSTIKENNITDKPHEIPMGTLVEVDLCDSPYHGTKAFIVDQTRDCNGNPTYSIGLKDYQKDLVETSSFRDSWLNLVKSSCWAGFHQNSLIRLDGTIKVVIGTSGLQLSVEAIKMCIKEGATGITIDDLDGDVYKLDEFPNDVGDGYYQGYVTFQLLKDNKVYTFASYNDEHRADPILVNIVEKLGESANFSYSKAKIIEIPNDVKWHIHECEDGSEYIRENSRTWE